MRVTVQSTSPIRMGRSAAVRSLDCQVLPPSEVTSADVLPARTPQRPAAEAVTMLPAGRVVARLCQVLPSVDQNSRRESADRAHSEPPCPTPSSWVCAGSRVWSTRVARPVTRSKRHRTSSGRGAQTVAERPVQVMLRGLPAASTRKDRAAPATAVRPPDDESVLEGHDHLDAVDPRA